MKMISSLIARAGAASLLLLLFISLGSAADRASAAFTSLLTISKSFSPNPILAGGTTTLTFTITNPNATVALAGVAFTDLLPAGLRIATPSGLSGTCGGGMISAPAGGGGVNLASASIAAGSSCMFSVNVTGTQSGPQ